jgi:hypothetical protein
MAEAEEKQASFFGKEESREKTRWPWIVVLLLVLIVPLSFTRVRHRVLLTIGLRERFDATGWIEATGQSSIFTPVRTRMVDDLLLNHEINGLTAADVGTVFGAVEVPQNGTVKLFVGATSFLGIESPDRSTEWIDLDLQDGVVANFSLETR